MLINRINKRDNTVLQFIVGYRNWSRDITSTQRLVLVYLLTTTREMRSQDRRQYCVSYLLRKILRNCSTCDFSLMNTQFDTGASRHMFMRVTLVTCMRMLLEPAQTKDIGSYLVFYHNIIHKSLPAWTIRTLYSSYFPYLPRRISGFRWAQFLCFKIVYYLFNTPT